MALFPLVEEEPEQAPRRVGTANHLKPLFPWRRGWGGVRSR